MFLFQLSFSVSLDVMLNYTDACLPLPWWLDMKVISHWIKPLKWFCCVLKMLYFLFLPNKWNWFDVFGSFQQTQTIKRTSAPKSSLSQKRNEHPRRYVTTGWRHFIGKVLRPRDLTSDAPTGSDERAPLKTGWRQRVVVDTEQKKIQTFGLLEDATAL